MSVDYGNRRLKVYGWNQFRQDIRDPHGRVPQVRTIVACPSFAEVQRRAKAVFGQAPGRDWVSETGNELEVRTALSSPGTIFMGRDYMGRDSVLDAIETHITSPVERKASNG
jgi:hypothetical protein